VTPLERALDPRLAPVLAEKRRSVLSAGLWGIGLLLVGAFTIAGKASSDVAKGTTMLVLLCLVLFIAPGLVLLRIWLRGPERTKLVRSLTEGRAELTGWRLDYVSENGGSTCSRVWLYSRTFGAEEVTLSHTEAKALIAYLTEVAPQATRHRS
jgi:hypothetical protein